MVWIKFAIAALLIVIAGFKLIEYGDVLSRKLKLGHAFVGAVLIGWCTSLPELVLSIGTACHIGKPEIAMGNVFGSNLFNLFIIVLLDIYYWKAPILRTVDRQVKLSAWLSLWMVILTVIAVISSTKLADYNAPHLRMGYDSLVIFGFYLLCMFILYKFENVPEPAPHKAEKRKDDSLGLLLIKCLAVMAIIVAVGMWMSYLADEIAEKYQLQRGFVGTFFLAVVSSLPEVITCIAAVRLGYQAMALGTLFGSNIFNMAIISFCDLFYRSGNIFAAVAINEKATQYSSVTSGITIVLMTMVILFVLRLEKQKEGKKKGAFIGVESLIIGILYLGALYLSYRPQIILSLCGCN